jgi:hypothetical protein
MLAGCAAASAILFDVYISREADWVARTYCLYPHQREMQHVSSEHAS